MAGKKFIGVLFRCCNVYGRAYKNGAGTAFEGTCPACRKRVRVPIDAQGTDCRFVSAHPVARRR